MTKNAERSKNGAAMRPHPQVAALLERAAQSPLPPYYDVPPTVARRLYRDSRAPLTPEGKRSLAGASVLPRRRLGDR